MAPGELVASTTALLMPTTLTGVALDAVVPSPSWPEELLPQHLTPPVFVSAHVCVAAPAIWVTSLVLGITTGGVPNPKPQHSTSSAVVPAHV